MPAGETARGELQLLQERMGEEQEEKRKYLMPIRTFYMI